MLSGDIMLGEAITNGRVEEVENLLNERDKEINNHPEQNRNKLKLFFTAGPYQNLSLMEIAASSGYVDIVMLLRNRGYPLKTTSVVNRKAEPHIVSNPLYAAILTNHPNVVRYLLGKGINASTPFISPTRDDETKLRLVTPLALAAGYKREEIVRILLNAGVNPTIYVGMPQEFVKYITEQNRSLISNSTCPMQDLIVTNNDEGIELIDRLAPVGMLNYNVLDSENRSLLHYSVISKFPPIVNFLINKGVVIDTINSFGFTPLLYCLATAGEELRESSASLPRIVECVKLLLDAGANPRYVNDKLEGEIYDDPTPIFYAVTCNSAELIKSLVSLGVDPNSGSKAMSALELAVTDNYLESAKTLLEAGANPNIKNQEGNTPIFYAVANGTFLMIKMLVEKGADVNLRDNENIPLLEVVLQTPWERFDPEQRKQKRIDFIRILLCGGADPRVLRGIIDAEKQNNPELHKYVINAIKLYDACDAKNLEKIVEVIHADPKLSEIRIGIDSLLHFLIKNSKTFIGQSEISLYDLISFIIKSGAPKTTYDKDNKTPLALAREMGLVKYYSLLTSKLDNLVNYALFTKGTEELIGELIAGSAIFNQTYSPPAIFSEEIKKYPSMTVSQVFRQIMLDRINTLNSFTDLPGLEYETHMRLKKLIEDAHTTYELIQENNLEHQRLFTFEEGCKVQQAILNFDRAILSHTQALIKEYKSESGTIVDSSLTRHRDQLIIDPQMALLKQAAKPIIPAVKSESTQAVGEPRRKPAAASLSDSGVFAKTREKPEKSEEKKSKRPRGKGSDSE